MKHFIDAHDVDLSFLSEPQAFSFDLKRYMDLLGHDFCAELNSDDKYDLDLPLFQNQSHGGTMAIWKRSVDKYITLYPVRSSSFLPVIFSPPGSPVSVHIGLYLPTSGQETQFVSQVTHLRILIEEIQEKYPDCMVYLRGDSNANTNNKQRYNIFENFLKSMKLNNVSIPHKTYHHFVGDGLYDSNIDVVLHSTNAAVERIETVICKLENPLVDSHHDIILSTFTLPVENVQSIDDNLETAPRVENKRVKIIWQDDRIADYQTEIGAKLSSLRNMWSSPSKTSFSILLDHSSSVLS